MLMALADRARDIRSLLSSRAPERTTEQDRARERHARIALSAGASLLAKAFSVGAALITVPLTLHYLGSERYGMWMTMSSLVAMLSFADLGIGNGVLSAVATAYGRDDRGAILEIVSSGFFTLTAIGVGILCLFALAYPFVPWFKLFNVESAQARAEAGPALAMLVACFALGIPAGIVQRTQMGLQRGFMASLWQCASSLCTLIALLVAIRFEVKLPWLVLAFAGTPHLAALANGLLFFGRLEPDIAPSRTAVSREAALRVTQTGMLFFALQIFVGVSFTSDNIVIAQLLGAGSVTDYSVPASMFNVITMLLSMALMPLWPSYGEAIARGDRVWVRKTFKRSVLISVCLAGLASFCLVLLGPTLLALWVGHVIDPPFLLLIGFGVWKVIEAGGNAFAMFLNGARIVRAQIVAGIATAACAIVLKIVLVGEVGVAGAVWATIISYLLFTALPLGLMAPRFLRQSVA